VILHRIRDLVVAAGIVLQTIDEPDLRFSLVACQSPRNQEFIQCLPVEMSQTSTSFDSYLPSARRAASGLQDIAPGVLGSETIFLRLSVSTTTAASNRDTAPTSEVGIQFSR
jgi:hypothetical protein